MSDERLLERLDRRSRDLLERCGEIAAERGEAAHLVGGVVRDLILGRASKDLDVVVEGDGIEVARALADAVDGRLVRYRAFQTARVEAPDGRQVDVATARKEVYPSPGDLPRVEPGTLREDLERRDFTINTLAIPLDPGAEPSIIDPFEGRRDLREGRIRILHRRSFADDPTRILRALRFAERFAYRLESETDRRLQEAVDGEYLSTISGDRIRRELQAFFREAPLHGPLRLQRRRILRQIHPGLEAQESLLEALQEERRWLAREGDGSAPTGDVPATDASTVEDGEKAGMGSGASDDGRGDGGRDPGGTGLAGSWTTVLAACCGGLSAADREELAGRLGLSTLERTPLIETGGPWRRARRELERAAGEPGRPLCGGDGGRSGDGGGGTERDGGGDCPGEGENVAGEGRRVPIAPSRVVEALDGLSVDTLLVAAAECRAGGRSRLEAALRAYLVDYRHVEPGIGGDELLAMGVPEGPRIGRILDRLRAARLDGEIEGPGEERRLARRLAAEDDDREGA